MKPIKKKKIEIKKVERKTAGEKDNRITAKKAVAVKSKPLVKIAAKIRSKVLNIKAVEKAKPVAEKNKIVEPEFEIKKTKIRIIGIGGGGGNIVSEIADKVKKSSFCIANTDFAALRNAPKNVSVFQFGENFTHGLGTGMDARIAEEAAAADRESIKKILEGQDLVIIVSSLGGGAGSGAAPVFAQISKSLGNLTYGIFTLPFVFEGVKKEEIARNALEKLKPYMNAMTILPNERVFEVVPKNTPFNKTLSHINTMLSDSLEGLIETIYDTGMINIDFADLRAILAGNGKMSFLNTVTFKKGDESNVDAFEKVFNSPLYPYTIDRARGLLLNIVAQKDLKLLEVNRILTSVAGRIHKDAKIIFGVGQEGAYDDLVKVTVLATGCVYDGGEDNGKEMAVPSESTKEKAANDQKTEQKPAGKKKTVQNKPVASSKAKNDTPKKTGTVKADKTKKKIEIKKPGSVKIKIAAVRESKAENIPNKEMPAQERAAADSSKEAENVYQNRQSIAAQFETPVRKNALQVKKEIEREENEMLEKEKAWEVPAFLRKQKK